MILTGHTLTVTAETIEIKGGVTVSTSYASGTAGNIVFNGYHITLDSGAKLLAVGSSEATSGDISLLAVDNNALLTPFANINLSDVDVTISSNAIISGRDVEILASADSSKLLTSDDWFSDYPANILGGLIEGLTQIGAGVSVGQSDSLIDIQTGTAITARNLTAHASSIVRVISEPITFMVGPALGIAITDAKVNVDGSITTTGNATFRSTTDHTVSVVSDTTGMKGIAAAVAISIIDSESNALVNDDAVLNIGGNLYVQADNTDRTRVMARSTAGEDGSVGVAIALTVENGHTNAYLDGTANVGGNIRVNATMEQDSVDINKLFVVPSTAIGTGSSAGVGSNSKGDFLDDAKAAAVTAVMDPIKNFGKKLWEKIKKPDPNAPAEETTPEPSYDAAAALAIVIDNNSTMARIGDGNADGDSKNGAVDALGEITVYSSITSSPYISAGASTECNPNSTQPAGSNKFSGAFAVSIGLYTNDAKALINSGATVDAGQALVVNAEALNDYEWSGYVNLVEPFLEKPTYTTEETDPNITVKKGNIVEVRSNHTGQGDAGTWYEYIGSAPERDINLLTEDFSDETLWESSNPAVRKGINFVRNLSTYLNSDAGTSNWFANDWTQATAEGESLAVAGSVTFLDLKNVAEAFIKSGARINQKAHTVTTQSVMVLATNHNQSVHFAGNISLPNPLGAVKDYVMTKGKTVKESLKDNAGGFGTSGKKGAVGATFGMYMYNDTTTARIEDGVVLHADSLIVDAETDVMSVTVGASGGSSDNIAFNGVVLVNVIDNHTVAQIENGAVIDVGAGLAFDPTDPDTDPKYLDPANNGSVVVTANDNTLVIEIAGAVASSEKTGIGASVTSNVVLRNTEAVIGDLAGDATSGTRGSFTSDGTVRLSADNSGFIGAFAVSGAIASSSSTPAAGNGTTKPPGTGGTQGSDGTKASNTNLSDWQTKMRAVLTQGVEKGKLAGNVAGDTASSINQTSQSKSAIGISGSVTVNVVDDNARAYIRNSGAVVITGLTALYDGTTIANDGTLSIDANNTTTVVSVAGAVSFAKGSGGGSSTGIAGAFGINVLYGTTDAFIDGATSLDLNGLDIAATRTGWNVSVAAGVAAAVGADKGTAVAGSVGVNVTTYTTETALRTTTGIVKGAVRLNADDDTYLIAIGGAGAFGGKTGVGVAISVSYTENIVRSQISSLTNFKHTGDLEVLATSDGLIVAVTGSVGVATGISGNGGAGTVSINIIKNTVEANILNSSTTADSTGNITTLAQDSTSIYSFAGAFAAGKNAGLGAAIAVNSLDNDVRTAVEGSTLLTNGSFSSKAKEDATVVSLAVAGAGSAGSSIAGSVGINLFNNTIDAHVSGSTIRTSGAVALTAEDKETSVGLGGGIAISTGTAASAPPSVFNLVFNEVTAHVSASTIESTASTVAVNALAEEVLVSVTLGGAGAKNLPWAVRFRPMW